MYSDEDLPIGRGETVLYNDRRIILNERSTGKDIVFFSQMNVPQKENYIYCMQHQKT